MIGCKKFCKEIDKQIDEYYIYISFQRMLFILFSPFFLGGAPNIVGQSSSIFWFGGGSVGLHGKNNVGGGVDVSGVDGFLLELVIFFLRCFFYCFFM
jgi:hypothetical protein